jgi:hypothetical protein
MTNPTLSSSDAAMLEMLRYHVENVQWLKNEIKTAQPDPTGMTYGFGGLRFTSKEAAEAHLAIEDSEKTLLDFASRWMTGTAIIAETLSEPDGGNS